MKKLLIATAAGILSIPAFAQEVVEAPVKPEGNPAVAQATKQAQRKDSFKQAREKHIAQFKASQEKMEKLVAEYNKMKAGKKKDAKKAEISQAVASIHEEQLAFKEQQLANFEQRVNKMKEELAKQNTPEEKQSWVDQHTEQLIAQGGNLRVLFDKPEGAEGLGKGLGFKGEKHSNPAMHYPGRPEMGPRKEGRGFNKPPMKKDESSNQ